MKRRVARLREEIQDAVKSIQNKAARHNLLVDDVSVRNRYGLWTKCKLEYVPQRLGHMSEPEVARILYVLQRTDLEMDKFG